MKCIILKILSPNESTGGKIPDSADHTQKQQTTAHLTPQPTATPKQKGTGTQPHPWGSGDRRGDAKTPKGSGAGPQAEAPCWYDNTTAQPACKPSPQTPPRTTKHYPPQHIPRPNHDTTPPLKTPLTGLAESQRPWNGLPTFLKRVAQDTNGLGQLPQQSMT